MVKCATTLTNPISTNPHFFDHTYKCAGSFSRAVMVITMFLRGLESSGNAPCPSLHHSDPGGSVSLQQVSHSSPVFSKVAEMDTRRILAGNVPFDTYCQLVTRRGRTNQIHPVPVGSRQRWLTCGTSERVFAPPASLVQILFVI